MTLSPDELTTLLAPKSHRKHFIYNKPLVAGILFLRLKTNKNGILNITTVKSKVFHYHRGRGTFVSTNQTFTIFQMFLQFDHLLGTPYKMYLDNFYHTLARKIFVQFLVVFSIIEAVGLTLRRTGVLSLSLSLFLLVIVNNTL